jgi:hypothetical protein
MADQYISNQTGERGIKQEVWGADCRVEDLGNLSNGIDEQGKEQRNKVQIRDDRIRAIEGVWDKWIHKGYWRIKKLAWKSRSIVGLTRRWIEEEIQRNGKPVR